MKNGEKMVPFVPGKAKLMVECDGPKVTVGAGGTGEDLLYCCAMGILDICQKVGGDKLDALYMVSAFLFADRVSLDPGIKIDVDAIVEAQRRMEEGPNADPAD